MSAPYDSPIGFCDLCGECVEVKVCEDCGFRYCEACLTYLDAESAETVTVLVVDQVETN